MAFIKEESEDVQIVETFRVKHEDTEQQAEMAFIIEESEDVRIEEAFRVKHEDTETQTGWFSFSKSFFGHSASLYLCYLPHDNERHVVACAPVYRKQWRQSDLENITEED